MVPPRSAFASAIWIWISTCASTAVSWRERPPCTCDRLSGDELILDTRDLAIHGVETAAGVRTRACRPGARCAVENPDASGAGRVRVHYSTVAGASGIAVARAGRRRPGKKHPFLFTQSQAIHARSWIPLQDTPGVRVTYTARIRTPEGCAR